MALARWEDVGVGDGVTRTFATSLPYAPGSVVVFLRGMARVASDPVEGWVETDPVLGTFTLHVAPRAGDVVQVLYLDRSLADAVVEVEGWIEQLDLAGEVDLEEPLAGTIDEDELEGAIAVEAMVAGTITTVELDGALEAC